MRSKYNFIYCCIAFLLMTIPVLAETEDFGNTSDVANSVAVNSTIDGELTSGDEDWVTFTPAANTKYKISYFNANSNWKYHRIYQDEGYENLTEVLYADTYHSSESYEVFFEYAEPVYIKTYGGEGIYNIQIEDIGTFLPDGYGNDAENATEIVVDADATAGTLTDSEELDYVDWFVFETDPLHKYHITISQTANSNIYFKIYDSTGTVETYGGTRDITLTSIHGENFKILVYGYGDRVGNYYELKVELDSVYTDQHGNYPSEATPILSNTLYNDLLEYTSNVNPDEDWLIFTPVENGRYEVFLNNRSENWKYARLYQDRGQENLEEFLYIDVYNQSETHDIFINSTDPVYIRIYGGVGEYDGSITLKEVIPPDSHPQSIATPENIAVGSTTPGTISPDQSVGSDYFIFNTLELHKYHLTISQSENSNIYFKVFNQAGTEIHGGTRNMDFVSWDGQSYIVQVYGDTNRIGNYYEFTVVDDSTYTDDYPNTIGQSVMIPKDGTEITGIINYTSSIYSDEEWMKFVAPIDGEYKFTVANEDSNWKYWRLYYYNNLNNLTQSFYYDRHNSEAAFTKTLAAGTYYLQVYGGLGTWRFSVTSPEPRCGDLEHPYPAADANHDCIVNITDLAIMASQWLTDINPEANDPS